MRRAASLVADISARVPAAVAANMALILPHIDAEAPTLLYFAAAQGVQDVASVALNVPAPQTEQDDAPAAFE